MTVLLDTGPILSMADRNDPLHETVKEAWGRSRGPFITSITVIPEACYLLQKFLGPGAELRFLESWKAGEIRVEPFLQKDLQPTLEILRTYQDRRFGFTDAALFVLAERFKLQRVFTLDHHHFDSFQPSHCSGWVHVIPARRPKRKK